MKMKKRRKRLFLSGLMLTFGLVACGEEKVDEKEPTPKAEQTATGDISNVAQGEKVAKSSCIGCHAGDLTGDMGPNLHNLALSKGEIMEVLEKGRGSMPPATAKGYEEEVAEYILTLK